MNKYYIGIKIKPINNGIQISELFKEKAIQSESHKKFHERFGGKVFYVYSTKVGDKKEIVNKEVISEINAEITRLKNTK